MSEWIYSQAGQVTRASEGLWLDLLNHELIAPARAFYSSIERLRKFWELAPHMMEVARFNISANLASPVLYKKHLYAGEQEFQAAIAEETRARLQKQYDETGSLKATGYDIDRAIEVFDKYFIKGTTFDEAVRAVLESQLSGAWTAFEVLSEDTWKGLRKTIQH